MSVLSTHSEPSQFKTLEESEQVQPVVRPPRCMTEFETHCDSSRPSLTREQVTSASVQQVVKSYLELDYPRTMRLHKDHPLNGQSMALYSFIPAKGSKPDLEGCYGVFKVRGCFSSESEADRVSEDIVRNQDSYAKIFYVPVGWPVPLMDDPSRFTAKNREIDIRRSVEDTYRNDLKKAREQEREDQRQLLQRQRDLERDVTEEKKEAVDDLDAYTQVRTKRAHVRYTIDELKRKRTEYEANLELLDQEIIDVDKQNPVFKDKFLERYKAALSSAGITDTSASLLKYM